MNGIRPFCAGGMGRTLGLSCGAGRSCSLVICIVGDLDVVVAMSPFGTLIEYLLVYGCGQAISWKAFRRDWRELASAGVDEGAEDATLVAIGAVGELRMPLDGPDETLGRHPDRLHDAVRRGGHRFQSLAQRANRLMVITVDAQRIGARMIRLAEGIDLIGLRLTWAVVSQRPQRAGQRRIGRDRHFVDHRVIRRLVAMMHDRAGMFVRQILPQRATQGDVEALDAAADAQQWLVRRDDGGDQAAPPSGRGPCIV